MVHNPVGDSHNHSGIQRFDCGLAEERVIGNNLTLTHTSYANTAHLITSEPCCVTSVVYQWHYVLYTSNL